MGVRIRRLPNKYGLTPGFHLHVTSVRNVRAVAVVPLLFPLCRTVRSIRTVSIGLDPIVAEQRERQRYGNGTISNQ